ncbi:30S ribosomal protein S17 domain protein [Helicobacter pylori GAM249T]|nr:30S ribosomal protein S17 domain protein [Helicobacter pylori GAM249T]
MRIRSKKGAGINRGVKGLKGNIFIQLIKSILQSKNATMFIFKMKGQFNHGLFRKSIRQSSY